MNEIKKVEFFDMYEDIEIVENPFSRANFVSKVKPQKGLGTYVGYDTGSGIAFFLNNFKFTEEQILIERSDVAGAVLIFNLGDDYSFTFEDGNTFVLKKNSYFLGFCSNKFVVNVDIKAHTEYITLTIGIKEELFLKLAHNLSNLNEKMQEAKKKNYAIIEGLEIDLEQGETLSSFRKNNLEEFLLTDLNLESKTISLIQYTIKKTINTINSNLDNNIIKSLQKAKKLINDEYARPLSIKEISYKSAINECYLKKDFKIYYNMTIYEMLQKRRMEVAKELLKEDYSVKEVALKIGYKHTGNFSKLFSTHFGLSPSIYKKLKK